MRATTAAFLGLALGVPAGCSVEQTLPAPLCEGDSSILIVAESVPTASQIPCLLPLPAGWSVASVRVNEHHTVVALDSDRAGERAAVLRLEQQCDIARSVLTPSDLPGADRYELIEQVEPAFRAERFYLFRGGCASWSFDFDRGVSATNAVAIGETLVLISREEFNDSLRQTFVDEEL